ncbi:MAG: UDP-N-acetylmuramate dehydrogenase [Pseudomonadales bacterium]|nr:UDP-N-acetylmuramate dehydrogenase [Pseudomonadales bacterium]
MTETVISHPHNPGLLHMKILENVDLRNFNTFHVSAHARYFAAVSDIAQLRQALDFCRQQNLSFMLIGQGSNLLFKKDYPGLVIELNIRGITRVQENDTHYLLRANAGENWHDFVLYCLDHACFGLENLSLIPGTVGAAPVQNIGAYGVEISECLHELEALEIASGSLRTFSNAECGFSYRGSVFKQVLKDQYIICSVTFRLSKTPRVNLSYHSLKQALKNVPEAELTPQRVSACVCEIRRSKLPDPGIIGNAGSFFWNPVLEAGHFAELQKRFPDIVAYPDHGKVKVAAAWLIEQAGWKGYREGDVGVHREHALVLVNHGQASGAQLYELSLRIQASVQAMFGIELQPEVRII